MKHKSHLISIFLTLGFILSSGSAFAVEYCQKFGVWGSSVSLECYALTPTGHAIKVGEGQAFGRDVQLTSGGVSARLTAYAYRGGVYAQGLDMFARPIPTCKAYTASSAVTDASGCEKAWYIQIRIPRVLR